MRIDWWLSGLDVCISYIIPSCPLHILVVTMFLGALLCLHVSGVRFLIHHLPRSVELRRAAAVYLQDIVLKHSVSVDSG